MIQQNQQPQQRAAESRTQSPPTDFEQLLKKDVKVMEFVPFGAQDKIKLTVKIIQDLIAVPTKSGKTCSERDALKFMMMCQAKRLNPFEGDAFLIGYDTNTGPQFSLITAHQAFLKRAEVHPEFDGMKSGIIVLGDDGQTTIEQEGDFHLAGADVVGGWATVFFKNRKVPTTRKVRLSRFNKGFAQWKDDPAGMICKCAEADALRSSFPTMVGGLYLREEMDFIPDAAPMKRPLFEASSPQPAQAQAKPEAALEPQPEQAPADDDSNPELMPEPAAAEAPQPEPAPVGNARQNYLKAVRLLCQSVKVKEGELLGFLAGVGTTDGSLSSLEELALHEPTVLQLVHDQWADISGKIIAARKGAK